MADLAKLRRVVPQLPPITDIEPEEGYLPPGWYSDHPVLEAIVTSEKPRLILDVGSLYGGSAARFAKHAAKAHPDKDFLVVAIDTWLGSTEHFRCAHGQNQEYVYGKLFDEFRRNMARAGVTNDVLPFPQTSANAAKILAFHEIYPDLIYLDASHEYDDVLQDLRNYWPLLAANGIIIGDDYEAPWLDLIRAADDFAIEINQKIEVSRGYATGMNDNVRQGQAKFIFRKKA